ncbi:MAG: isoprenylcysteine carboxylmethyltransferase family protein, partial [Candidatus Acidiferrales bacterium]
PVPFVGPHVYNVIFIASYVCWLLFEFVTGRARRSGDPKRARDRGSFRFLILMIWAGIALAFAACFGVQQAAIPWMRTAIFFLGIALMWAGIAFRYYAMRVLGRYFTFQVDVHSGQTVIEAGPYHYVRHPSYTGALITVLGLGLALGNWGGLLALVTCVGIGYAYRIHVEEAALVAALGEPYKEYMGRTQRLVPFVL